MATSRIDLLNLKPPEYADKYLRHCCRTKCPLMMVGKNGSKEVDVPADALVMVLTGRYLSEPEPDDDCYRFHVVQVNGRGKVKKGDVTHAGISREMLEPEPGVVGWHRECSAAAMAQGWDIFWCDGSDGPLWQLCKLDEDDRFKNDEDAWAFVWKRATEYDSIVARQALAFLYYRCPDEYKHIREHSLKHKDD